jgi:hypothetical protein
MSPAALTTNQRHHVMLMRYTLHVLTFYMLIVYCIIVFDDFLPSSQNLNIACSLPPLFASLVGNVSLRPYRVQHAVAFLFISI